MRAVVYQHDQEIELGRLAGALAEAGFALTRRFRAAEYEDMEAELLVVLGGSMAAGELEQHPFLKDELAVLSHRLSQSRPCLGLGLGAQLLASAAGAELLAGRNGFEVGVAPVRWTQAGMADSVLAGVRSRTPVAHWHLSTLGPVPGATLLASTDRYTQQAFRLGDSFGFQFHPELDERAFSAWLEQRKAELAAHGVDPSQLRAQLPKLKAVEGELGELLGRLVHHFAAVARRR